jgi:hypothetical protein
VSYIYHNSYSLDICIIVGTPQNSQPSVPAVTPTGASTTGTRGTTPKPTSATTRRSTAKPTGSAFNKDGTFFYL